MSRVRDGLRALTRAPGVPQARYVAERSVAPYVREQVHQLGIDHGLTVQRLASLEHKVDQLLGAIHGVDARLAVVEGHQPAVLNAISSSNGTARVLARRVSELEQEMADTEQRLVAADLSTVSNLDDARSVIASLEGHIQGVWDRLDHAGDEFRPHIGTIAFLLQRVETIRAEMMHELRYGPERATAAAVEARVLNPAALAGTPLRVNLGAGHLPMEGFANVDMRELPGIDIVAAADDLPLAPGSVHEFFSSHTIEHFPELELRRRLLPYWVGLLAPGGTFRAVVPDLDAMARGFADGSVSFDAFRSVTYGGQEYEGDFHFAGFSPESLASLLGEVGLVDIVVIDRARVNGDCLEFEIRGTRP